MHNRAVNAPITFEEIVMVMINCLIKLSILATPVQSPNVAQNMATTTVTASSH